MTHQVTIVAADHTGLIVALSRLLAAAGINITDIRAQAHDTDAIIQIEVDRYEDTLRVLTEEDYHVVTDDSVLLRIPDQPGGLANIAQRLAEAQVDIRSLRVVQRHLGFGVIAVTCNDNAKARELLKDVVVR